MPYEAQGSFAVASPIDVDQVASCSSTFYASRVGVWYEFVGNGRCVEATTESFSSRVVSAFTGACDNLLCANEGGYNYFRAEEGVTYRIAVAGEGFKGPFTFQLKLVSIIYVGS